MSKPIHQILLEPLLTEKSVAIQTFKNSKVKKYTFKVAVSANKIEIAKAVEAMFASEKVKVASVNTIHVRGKMRRVTGRKMSGLGQMGKSPDWKKAIVTLTADSPSIAMLEGV